jgi:hypothetical protein
MEDETVIGGIVRAEDITPAWRRLYEMDGYKS